MLPRRLKYVKVQPGAANREYQYFRHKGVYQRLPDPPGCAEYHRRYAELLASTEVKPEAVFEGSVKACIDDFRASTEFQALKPKTQKDYDRELLQFDVWHDLPLKGIERKHIKKVWETLKDRPRKQKLFAQVASRLFEWAIDAGLVDTNPAKKIKRVGAAQETRGWTDAEVDAFSALCPPGPMMTAFMLALYTGQRQGDVLKMARTSYDGSIITLRQSKTGTSLRISAHRDLKAYLETLPGDTLLFVTDANGRPFSADRLRKQFVDVRSAAELRDDLQFRGLRNTAANRLAEAGATPHQIQAITGHKTLSMVEKYTRNADQDRLGRQAIHLQEVSQRKK